MNNIEKVDVLIIGAGPAGMSTALHLVRIDPSWKNRLVVIDKAIFPREKLCAGGVTQFGVKILSNLDLSYTLPSIPINKVLLVFRDKEYCINANPVLNIVTRTEFDNWLVHCGEEQGIIVKQGLMAKDIEIHHDYLKIITDQIEFRTKILVAADGANSFTRRSLNWEGFTKVGIGLQIQTLLNERNRILDNKAIFDFSQMEIGLQGYCWEFPGLENGNKIIKHGIFNSNIHPNLFTISTKKCFENYLNKNSVQMDEYRIKSQSVYLFDKKNYISKPRVLLAGDAAGVDPLFGEGISYSLGYGEII